MWSGRTSSSIERCICSSIGAIANVAVEHLLTGRYQPNTQCVGGGAGYHYFTQRITADDFVTHSTFRLELSSGVCGGNRDHARRGILAKEQRLRTFQQLDALDVDKSFVDHSSLSVIDAVNNDCDGLFDADAGKIGADTAQAEVSAGTAVAAGDDQSGRDRCNLFQRIDVVVVNPLGGEHSDSDRSILRQLRNSASSHNHRAELGSGGRGRLTMHIR